MYHKMYHDSYERKAVNSMYPETSFHVGSGEERVMKNERPLEIMSAEEVKEMLWASGEYHEMERG